MLNPVKYDPTTAPKDDEGLFYDGDMILSVIQSECDEECDYAAGYVSVIVGYYRPGEDQFGDANFYGYRSTREYMEDEYHTDGVWRLADMGYDCGTFDELVAEVMDCEGIDLLASMRAVDALA